MTAETNPKPKTALAKRAPAPKKTPAKRVAKAQAGKTPSKADLVRALLDKGKTVRECADLLKDQGVTWAYAWDVAAAYEKKTGKVFIASHAPKATRKAAGK